MPDHVQLTEIPDNLVEVFNKFSVVSGVPDNAVGLNDPLRNPKFYGMEYFGLNGYGYYLNRLTKERVATPSLHAMMVKVANFTDLTFAPPNPNANFDVASLLGFSCTPVRQVREFFQYLGETHTKNKSAKLFAKDYCFGVNNGDKYIQFSRIKSDFAPPRVDRFTPTKRQRTSLPENIPFSTNAEGKFVIPLYDATESFNLKELGNPLQGDTAVLHPGDFVLVSCMIKIEKKKDSTVWPFSLVPAWIAVFKRATPNLPNMISFGSVTAATEVAENNCLTLETQYQLSLQLPTLDDALKYIQKYVSKHSIYADSTPHDDFHLISAVDS
ncbi:hypothetical protein BCR33DRAFT_799212 [Rhizoclosmatium globosum]|uniref:Uncharacterized protein n=1 Tax=Rhizoclosmatium globosum TaxID=329046 RepID=A0A1Y2ABH7_9FUNG|nr:hypothetical protein BCR33DRAFT_799212 [Rhizoclosmatium globosum]|eukprot:ORY19913.1 hypothetical protein BCR33DRAFT_799212 [Rhizoclosmatium globosum]